MPGIKCQSNCLSIRTNQTSAYASYRNLAVVRANDARQAEQALPLLRKALILKPADEQLTFEYAYLSLRMNVYPKKVIRFLQQDSTKDTREDILIEWARALNLNGEYQQALSLLDSHTFTPCEGGEHAIAEQYMFAHHALGLSLYGQGLYAEALVHFQKAQVLPDNLGAGLWNDMLLVPHQYYEARCLQKLNRWDEAQAVLDHILLLKTDYFSNMFLPELACWQAKVYLDLDKPVLAEGLLSAHVRAYRQMHNSHLAGHFKATPFFISYQPNPQTEQQAFCNWQLAKAQWAAGDLAAAIEVATAVCASAPTHLYAKLLSEQLSEARN